MANHFQENINLQESKPLRVAFITNPTFAHIIINDNAGSRSFNVSRSSRLFDAIVKQAELAALTQSVGQAQVLLDMLLPNKFISVATNNVIEYDEVSNRCFLKGTNEPLPVLLGQRIIEAVNAGIPVDHLVKFWQRCLENPDPIARNDLFWFLEKEGHPITEDGLFVAYKKVVSGRANIIQSVETSGVLTSANLREFIADFSNVIKQQTLNANLLKVYMNTEGSFVALNPEETVIESNLIFIGTFTTLYEKVTSLDFDDYVSTVSTLAKQTQEKQVFTDSYSRTMHIELGSPVRLDRNLCDSNPNRTCSVGLHIGAMRYVQNFKGNTTLVCLVNPRDVVAVPKDYNGEKMRVCEYLPLSISTGEIIEIGTYKTEQIAGIQTPTFPSIVEDEDEEDEDFDDDSGWDDNDDEI